MVYRSEKRKTKRRSVNISNIGPKSDDIGEVTKLIKDLNISKNDSVATPSNGTKKTNNLKVQCEYCSKEGKTFSCNQESLSKHINSVHKKKNKYICSVKVGDSICNSVFHRNDLLTRHINDVHNKEDSTYKCIIKKR